MVDMPWDLLFCRGLIIDTIKLLACHRYEVGRRELGSSIDGCNTLGVIDPTTYAIVVLAIVPLELDGRGWCAPSELHL